MAFGIVSAFILWRVNPTITLTVFVPLIVVTIIVNQSRTRVARYREQSQAATSQVTGMLGEMFSGILTLKLYNSEIHALDRLQKLNQEREAAAVQDRMFGELLDTVSGNLSDIGAGVILLLVGQAMQSGSFTVGDFALFVYILPWAGTFTNAFGGILAGYRRLGVSWARLATMLDGDDPARLTQAHALPLRADIPVGAYETNPITSSLVVASPKTPVQRLSTKGDNSPFLMCGRLGGGLLYEARGLTFTYPDSANGVHAVDLQLPPSSLTVITGRIGSGKSTLLRLLLGLLPKEAGEIYWHGELVTDPDRFFVPPRTAYTPQTPALFSNSLRANILMGLDLSGNEEGFAESHRDWHKDSQRARKENAEAQASVETALQNAIHAAVLEEDINMLEQGLDTLVGPRGVRLSGGQLLRSAAARMFVRQPELLVFDDLSSALDAETENLLWDRLFGHGHQLENAQPHATCLIVSHRQSALQRADNILVLEEGRVTDSGRLEDLLQRSEEMQQLYQGGENG